MDISNDTSVCNTCNKEYMILEYYKIRSPESIPMHIVKVG